MWVVGSLGGSPPTLGSVGKMTPRIKSVRDHIAWSYANLARIQTALMEGSDKLEKTHHAIRARMWRGLRTQELKMGSLFDDERLKMTMPQACYYCGQKGSLSVDHLIPRIKGGPREADNLIWACRSCNSSKQGRDMLVWMAFKGKFPPVLLLRRYMKIVALYCEEEGIMELDLEDVKQRELPFAIDLLPYKFPRLSTLRLWVYPVESE